MDVRRDPPRADLERIVADVPLDEAFDYDADLVVVGYEGDEPVGLVAGRIAEIPEAGLVAIFEHVRIRPAYQRQGRSRPLIRAWAELCLDRGLTRALGGITRGWTSEELAKLVAGTLCTARQYHGDATRTWWAQDIRTAVANLGG